LALSFDRKKEAHVVPLFIERDENRLAIKGQAHEGHGSLFLSLFDKGKEERNEREIREKKRNRTCGSHLFSFRKSYLSAHISAFGEAGWKI